jgi:shikimate dehydrogenase
VPDSPIQQIVCCLGQPVAGNPTQFMMERAFAAAGLDWRYLTLEVPPERLGDAVKGLGALGFRGGNLAIPHKVAVLPHLDELSEAATWIGAVNCVVCRDGKLIGENTDGKGVVRALQQVTDPAGQRVVILGAGGMARAIAVELGLVGVAEIVTVNRTAERGQNLVDLLDRQGKVSARLVHLSGDYAVEEGFGIVINATPIGWGDSEIRVPLNLDSLHKELVVADVVFNPPQTQLIREAAARGCTTVDGLGMFVSQAMIAFKLWTGVEPDPAVMREAVEEYLEI